MSTKPATPDNPGICRHLPIKVTRWPTDLAASPSGACAYVYRRDFDDPARRHFATLSSPGQEELAAFMNAAVLVDPIEYQRHPGEPADATKLLRTLHFGRHHEDSSRSWSPPG